MYIVAGLGNPGREYENTRHNVGFDVIDLLAKKYNIEVNRLKFKGEYGETTIGQDKVLFIKPNTYMNLSGESLGEISKFFKVPSTNIIVIQDDVDLPLGRLRIRTTGSAGGHNGLKSIIAHLGTEDFVRIRIGVGQPAQDMITHVLGKIPKEQQQVLNLVYKAASEAVEIVIKEGSEAAMNKFNGFTAQ